MALHKTVYTVISSICDLLRKFVYSSSFHFNCKSWKKIKTLLSIFLLTPPASCHSNEKLFVWMDLVFDPAFICLQKILYTVTNWRDYCIYSLMKSQSKKTLLSSLIFMYVFHEKARVMTLNDIWGDLFDICWPRYLFFLRISISYCAILGWGPLRDCSLPYAWWDLDHFW